MQKGVVHYTRPAVALHWLVAVAFLANAALGLWMGSVPKGTEGLRAGWFNVHKSIGLTIGLLVVVRLFWRLRHPPPPPPASMPGWQLRASGLVHGLLYLFLLVQPISGLLGSLFTRYPIKYFGAALPLPHHDWPAGKEAMSVLHLASACLLTALVSVHVAAAAWHALRRDGVLQRMLWHSRETP
jgi:cytochrome b561